MKPLVELVKKFEGLHRVGRDGLVHPYICPAGYPTIGYGILVRDMNVPPITPEQAENDMLAALPAYVAQTLKAVPNLAAAPEGVLWAISDFTFNLGSARLRASTLRRKLLNEDWEGAKTELRKWVRGGGKKLPGLVLRREAECALF